MSDPSPLLRDLIDIPERAHTDTFVLKLAEGLAHADETLADYVVTRQLAECFDQALDLIKGATSRGRSEATYLHGSFGSGKSHFMAVLGLLLAGHPKARAIPELATVVAKHNQWTEGKRFLMVPYHMIGATEVEAAILGGYARHVRALHPQAPIPGFYLGERLFEDARNMRAAMGDAAFFAKLNEGAENEGWGDLDRWDAGSFEAAQLQPPEGPEGTDRQRLVGDLIGRMFTSYSDVAAAGAEAFVGLDAGLEIASRHAKELGYDAIILFLDELILWLASNAANVQLISREGPKLAKLVEAERMDRPIPIVSFVPRQRDLRELVGAHQAGAIYSQLEDMLNWWNARFRSITLENRNLPVIAQRRLLRPRDDQARILIDDAFNRFADRQKQVIETLLGSDGGRELFRKVYPFSPALMQTLIAASEVLQRERTALRVMLTMLMERRNDLRLGQLIPVGDLWDVLSTGAEPFSQGMRIQFENARKLWTQKLLPALERRHAVTWQDMMEGRADATKAMALRNEARLFKTLLLAALIPEVPALRSLNAARLAALNHGSVISPIPGREGNEVLRTLRALAAEVGEIKLTEEPNPVISLQITGVDIEPILANVAAEDNEGNRRRKVRDIVFAALGIPNEPSLLVSQGFVEYSFEWRKTRRQVDLWLESVAALSDDRLRGRGGTTTVIMGMPFDSQGHGPADDGARLDRFNEDADTVVWLPSQFSERALRELGTLVRIDFLLVRNRLEDAARHLSPSDREQARALLQNQQSQLYQRLRASIEAAYGIRHDQDNALGLKLDAGDQLVSLDQTFQPQLPVGADLKEALGQLLDRIFAHRYPAHPLFEEEVKPSVLRKVLEEVQCAAQEADQRALVERPLRTVLSGIAGPLRLGTMGATHFVLDPHWASHFGRLHAQSGDGPMNVGQLRAWMDQPRAMGLTKDTQNLVVLSLAAQADRSFTLRGAPIRPTLDRIDDETELRAQPLPDEASWTTACARAASLFGLAPSQVRKTATVEKLAGHLLEKAASTRAVIASLMSDVRTHLSEFGGDAGTASRLTTLGSVTALLSGLAAEAEPHRVVAALVSADLQTSETAVAQSLAHAGDLQSYLGSVQWYAIKSVAKLSDYRRAAGESIARAVADALAADEHVRPLRAALAKAQEDAFNLLAAAPLPSPNPSAGPAPAFGLGGSDAGSPLPSRPDEVVIDDGAVTNLGTNDALNQLEHLRRTVEGTPGAMLTVRWRITRTRP